MGKGDKKTKRGKINLGTYGNTRQKKLKAVYIKKHESPKSEAK